MKHLSVDGETVVLNKFTKLNPAENNRTKKDQLAIFLDVETTGLSAEVDQVIQLAIRPFYFNPDTFEVTGIARKTTLFNDPGEPLREEIIKFTGLTDEDIAGHSIDWEWVHSALHRPKFIIAHNAKFDRGFIEAALESHSLTSTDGPIWACSLNQVDWQEAFSVKIPSKSLEVLCAWSGFFYDSHQADADIDALFHLLRHHNKLEELITRGSQSEHRVFAANFPREENAQLKRRWYRWDPNVFMWWKAFELEEEAKKECEWLTENFAAVEPQMFELDPKYRYSPE